MIKLPQLQPHLTGSNGVESKEKNSSFLAPFARSQSATGPGENGRKLSGRTAGGTNSLPLTGTGALAGMDMRGWEVQSKEITKELPNAEKYKSLALAAEVRLTEALERCERAQPTMYTSNGDERPGKLKTAVCTQLLGEFAEMCGPFCGVLRILRDVLAKSLYSWHFATERGFMAFDQLPWFTVAERLEKEKQLMMEERDRLLDQFEAQEVALARINEQVAAFQSVAAAAQAETAALSAQQAALVANEESAKTEARVGREELKRVRKDYLKAKDDYEAEKAALIDLRARHENFVTSAATEMDQYQATAAAAMAEATEARSIAESRVAPEAVDKVRSQLESTQKRLNEVQSKFKEVEAQRDKLAKRLDLMTPRPAWRHLEEHGLLESKRTAETVRKAEEKLSAYATELDEVKAKLTLASALLLPDPPASNITIPLITDGSNYFITEGKEGSFIGGGGGGGGISGGGGGGGGGASEGGTAEGLGLSSYVPRCLRWQSTLTIKPLKVQFVEATIIDLWRARGVLARKSPIGGGNISGGGRQPLHSFMHWYFHPRGLPTEESMAAAYSFFVAAAASARESSLVKTFWKVVTGQLAESVVVDQQLMLTALGNAVEALPSADSNGGVRRSDVNDLIQIMFAFRSSFKINRMKDALGKQYPSDVIPRPALRADLTPLLKVPEGGSSSRSSFDTKAINEYLGSHLSQDGELYGSFMDMLLTQQLEDLEASTMEALARLTSVSTTGSDSGGGGDGTYGISSGGGGLGTRRTSISNGGLNLPTISSGSSTLFDNRRVSVSEAAPAATLSGVVAALQGIVGGRGKALRLVLRVVGCTVDDIGGGLAVEDERALEKLGAIPEELKLDLEAVTQQLQATCLLRPDALYDLNGVYERARAKKVKAAAAG